jgi:hypothetical protein
MILTILIRTDFSKSAQLDLVETPSGRPVCPINLTILTILIRTDFSKSAQFAGGFKSAKEIY